MCLYLSTSLSIVSFVASISFSFIVTLTAIFVHKVLLSIWFGPKFPFQFRFYMFHWLWQFVCYCLLFHHPSAGHSVYMKPICVCVWVCMWMCLCVACSCHLTVKSNYHLIYRCHRYGCRLSVPQLDCSTFWARFVEVNLLRKRKPLPYTVILALIFGQKEEDSTTCWRFANKQTGES